MLYHVAILYHISCLAKVLKPFQLQISARTRWQRQGHKRAIFYQKYIHNLFSILTDVAGSVAKVVKKYCKPNSNSKVASELELSSYLLSNNIKKLSTADGF